jgi:hypothetical protein
LKDHLEKVQVCLGAIDEWVKNGVNDIKFLESPFGVKIDDIVANTNGIHCCTSLMFISIWALTWAQRSAI